MKFIVDHNANHNARRIMSRLTSRHKKKLNSGASMAGISLGIVVIGLIVAAIIYYKFYYSSTPLVMERASIIVTSSAFQNNMPIPAIYTCTDQDISPPLEISGVQSNAKSLVLIMEDPDSPGGTWTHWLKWNIPATTTTIEEGVEPPGTSGAGSAGILTYQGPCPGSGTHHYHFKVYSLNTQFDVPEGNDVGVLRTLMSGHILQEGELVGLYTK